MNDLRFADYFLFTQHSLATFDKCPLKFKKRYLENLKWESFPDEEVKKSLERGTDFHLLAYRYFMGIDAGVWEDMQGCEELQKWMGALAKSFTKSGEFSYYPEYKLRMAKDNLRLEANFDLLIVKGDNIEIWDWKTHGKENTNRIKRIGQENDKFTNSLQTKVYMCVLMEQCERILGKRVAAHNISMCYWQPEPPKVLAQINYSDEMHTSFKNTLVSKINNILGYDYSGFDKALYQESCKYCEFNWFCNNQRVDFNVMKEDEDFLDEFDWNDIEELT